MRSRTDPFDGPFIWNKDTDDGPSAQTGFVPVIWLGPNVGTDARGSIDDVQVASDSPVNHAAGGEILIYNDDGMIDIL